MTPGRQATQVGPPLTASLLCVGPQLCRAAVRRPPLQVETCCSAFLGLGAFLERLVSAAPAIRTGLGRFGKGPDCTDQMGQRGAWSRLQFHAAPAAQPQSTKFHPMPDPRMESPPRPAPPAMNRSNKKHTECRLHFMSRSTNCLLAPVSAPDRPSPNRAGPAWTLRQLRGRERREPCTLV